MAAKIRPATFCSREARDHVLDVIRSTVEPLPARSLARLLAEPFQMSAADLVRILDECLAAGRLYVLLPTSARGTPRYWDRDATALVRSAVIEAVQRSERPRTARDMIGAPEMPFKMTQSLLEPALNELVAARTIYEIAPATAKGKARYWHRDALEFARQEMLKLLAAKGAQSAASLKKTVKELSQSQFEQVVESAIAAHVLWRHPPLGKSKQELIGNTPPSPDPYLRDVGSQLTRIVAVLKEAHVPRDELRRCVVQLLETAGIEFTAGTDRRQYGKSSRGLPSVDLIELMRRLEPRADRGALVGARDLRRAAQLDKQAFDDAVLEQAKLGRLSLHRHDYAAGLSPAEREDLVADGAGTYYVGMALRCGGAS